MYFDIFQSKLLAELEKPLPGIEAHFKLAPYKRLIGKNAREKDPSPKLSAVLALLFPKNNEPHILLTLRNTYKGVHSKQVSFPGGKREKIDTSFEQTALRETEEEIGVKQNKVVVLKKLTEIYIPPSNFFVQPFIGYTDETPNFILQENEVEELIEVPLSNFMDDSIKSFQNLSTSYAKNIKVPVFNLNNQVVWGATAMMLSEVREMLKQLL